uniref:GRF-type domain-containing protein n=1 Tax=Hordeum vulgare subsp. vulgare TaxID=112509 RepID=A0A8I6X2E6_HORVV
MSSFSVGSCSGAGIRRRCAAARSPVSYREQPMDYEPTVFCSRCGRKAPRWISWSVPNPGRRYYACVESKHGFLQWHDEPTYPFLRVLLGDLRDRVWSLEDSVAALCGDGDPAAREVQERTAGAGAVQEAVHERTAGVGVVGDSVRLMVCGIVIFVSGLFVGMIIS